MRTMFRDAEMKTFYPGEITGPPPVSKPTDYYCPHCGKQAVEMLVGPEDYYLGHAYRCKECGGWCSLDDAYVPASEGTQVEREP